MDIGAFNGKDAENNRIILETLALKGSLIKWEILKKVKETKKKITWATVSRRVDDLKERGYITETGKRRTSVAKREQDSPIYGLTWKGLVASLPSHEVRNNIVKVIEMSPHLKPLHTLLSMTRGIYTEDEIRDVTDKFYKAVRLIPLELESVNETDFFFYLSAALFRTDFSIPEKDLSKLEQNPELLKFLYNAVIKEEESTVKSLENLRGMKAWLEQRLRR